MPIKTIEGKNDLSLSRIHITGVPSNIAEKKREGGVPVPENAAYRHTSLQKPMANSQLPKISLKKGI